MRAYLVVLSLLLAGCPANFIEAWEVTEPRLVGVRVETADAAGNPRPRLDQTFNLRQYLAIPGPLTTPLAGRYSIALALCLGIKTPIGTFACFNDQTLTPTLSTVSDTEILLGGLSADLSQLDLPPSVSFDVSSIPELAAFDSLGVFGGFCVDGTAERVPGKSLNTDAPSDLFRCTNNTGAMFPDLTAFTLSVFLDRGLPSDANKNPSFDCDPGTPESPCFVGVQRDDEPLVGGAIVLAYPVPKQAGQLRSVMPWLASVADPNALPFQECASNSALLKVHAGDGDYVIHVRFDPSDRETYPALVSLNGVETTRSERETLDLTSALSSKGGKLAEFESRILGSEVDAKGEISVTYKPPKQSADPAENIPPDGRLVRFYFTLRDQRGGLDYAMRELCLVPAEEPGNQE